ncbi:MAG: NAD+ synthase [Halobacteriaceae archaeon]
MSDATPVADPASLLDLSEAELAARRDRITEFLADVVEDAGATGAVIGLSGGVDSTTTAHLTVEALGADRVRALVMPGTVSSDQHMSDAERVARSLDVASDVVEIEPIVEQVVGALPETAGDRVAVGNTRARVRAVLNYLVANHEDRVVVGTGNRSEALVGYFTKYGDGAVDCHPIGNLYKRQVRAMARHLGVAEDLVTKTPSAELWADQTDEDELGLDYDTLDAILALHVDGPAGVAATADAVGVDRATVERVDDMVAQSAHKRSRPPAPDPPGGDPT